MIMTLLFFSSCHELHNEPLLLEKGNLQMFDRLKFLSAVKNASHQYGGNNKSQVNNLNFRISDVEDPFIEGYLEEIASEYNNEQQWYHIISADSWGDPIDGHIFSNEIVLDKINLTHNIKNHVDNYESIIDNIINQYENLELSADEVINQIKFQCRNRGNLINMDSNLSIEERADLSEIFYTVDQMGDDIILLLEDPYFEGQRLLSNKFIRAFARIAVAVAITAVLVYTGTAALAIFKVQSLSFAHAAGWAALTSKASIGAAGALYPALLTGLGAGIKNAGTYWNYEWRGLADEGKYAVKVAW